jgi:ABC-2 type transport system ATP-binding protein
MLKIQNVSATYGAERALRDVSLAVQHGEIVGVVGPNGAGKTTLFKILVRSIERYEGSVTFDEQPLAELTSCTIGYVAQNPFLFEFFTPVEMLLFERSIKFPQLPGEEVFTILHMLGLESCQHKPIKTLSEGLKKRVAIAAAFLGAPSLVVLDEPLNSLDIQSVIVLKRLIREALLRGATVLISSHVLDFFDGLIERIVFLDHGVIHHISSEGSENAEDLYIKLFMAE